MEQPLRQCLPTNSMPCAFFPRVAIGCRLSLKIDQNLSPFWAGTLSMATWYDSAWIGGTASRWIFIQICEWDRRVAVESLVGANFLGEIRYTFLHIVDKLGHVDLIEERHRVIIVDIACQCLDGYHWLLHYVHWENIRLRRWRVGIRQIRYRLQHVHLSLSSTQ